VYADVSDSQASSASTIASTAQQMSISFGVATASLIASVFLPDRSTSGSPEMIQGIHHAFLILGSATIVSTVVFHGLRRDDGNAVSRHRAVMPPA